MAFPSKYSETIADEICARLSKGEPLAVICRDKDMPSVQAVGIWRETHKDFGIAYARAREEGFDAIAGDCLVIADDDQGDPQRDKLRVDTRLKLLAKWCPKRYGERVEVEHAGKVTVEKIRRVIVDPANGTHD